MKKDDIIGQKLFETCKLSEFYLNLIVNNRLTDPDSPFELALAFKQKLYEIVERYDRLLEAASQRQQLTLQLQHAHKPPLAPSVAAAVSSTTRTSTLSRSAAVTPSSNQRPHHRYAGAVTLGSGGLISPLNVSTSVMNGLNCMSQPATPLQQCYHNHHTLNHHHLANTATSASLSTTVSRSSSATNFSIKTYNKSTTMTNKTSTPSRYKQSPSTPLGLSSSGQSEAALKLRIAAIYQDDWDEDDFDDRYSSASSSSSSSSSSKTTDHTKTPSHLSRDLDVYGSSSSAAQYDQDDLDDEVDEEVSGQTRDHIEKSFSNLSKDSGMLADSYHSDYSNQTNQSVGSSSSSNSGNQSMILSGVGCCMSPTGVSCHDSPPPPSPVIGEIISQQHDEMDMGARSSPASSSSSTDPEMSGSEAESNATLPTISSLTLGMSSLSSSCQSSMNSPPPSLPHTTNFALIKQSLVEKNNKSTCIQAQSQLQHAQVNDMYRTYTKKQLSSQFCNHHQQKNKSNSNFSLSSITSSLNNSTVPSPGSSTSGISCVDNNNNNNKNISSNNTVINTSDSLQSSTSNNGSLIAANNPPQSSSPPNSANGAGQNGPPFFFNYNSLMNVSMLDSIQVTNTSLDFDNMSSSILMFN